MGNSPVSPHTALTLEVENERKDRDWEWIDWLSPQPFK